MLPVRRLVATMFTDIVGYTAMMHHNEEEAIALVKRHQEVLEACVATHQGEVLQYYGDGSLTIFNSAIEALQCAMEVQQELRKEPRVPLRIGIHMGEIRLEEEKAYGDVINLASRIESIGQEGTVLFSGDVFENIRNHPEFRAVSLGTFDFKNVDELIEVFALANDRFPIPRREEMEGKLKQTRAVSQSSFWKNIAVVLVCCLLAAVGYWWMNFRVAGTLPESIREARIAVIPYQNNTNDPTLDVVGEMVADWLIQGMMNLEGTQVVSYQTIKDAIQNADPIRERKFRQVFQRQTGAQKIIRGTYYRQGEQLIFQSQIIDVLSGNVEFVLPEITGNEARIMDLVNELRQRILGYFSLVNDQILSLEHKPPKYEAYKIYLQAYSYFGTDYDQSRKLCDQAIAIDSSFLWPYLTVAGSFYNQGNTVGLDSVITVVNRRFRQLNAYERAYLEWAKTMSTSDLVDDYQLIKPIFSRDPKNLRNNYLMGYSASMLNKPYEAVRYFNLIDPEDLKVKYPAQTWWHLIYTYNLIRLDSLDKASYVLGFIPEELASLAYYYRRSEIYIRQGREDKLQQLIAEVESRRLPDATINNLYVYISIQYQHHQDTDRHSRWFRLAVDKIRSQSGSPSDREEMLAGAYYFTKEYPKALPLYLERVRTGNITWYYLARIGSIYARLGEVNKAIEVIRQMEELDTPETIGQYRYATALVYSMLGEQEKAVEHMQQAFRMGFGFTASRYKDAFEFLPLHGYSPFEEFVKPNG